MNIRILGYSGLCLLVLCSVLTSLADASTSQREIRSVGVYEPETSDSSSVLFPNLQEKRQLEQHETLKLAVEDISFNCQQGCCGHYYDHCDLHIHYNTHLKEGMHLPVATAVTCDGAIEYKTEDGDLLINESEPVTVHRTLLTEPRDDAYVSLDFPFSYYEGVVEAQLTSVKCRIDREELYSSITGEE